MGNLYEISFNGQLLLPHNKSAFMAMSRRQSDRDYTSGPHAVQYEISFMKIMLSINNFFSIIVNVVGKYTKSYISSLERLVSFCAKFEQNQ